ncbi:hypothetical protein FZEAL_3652 [Fusarium zealandicum]|uniref:Uncharacterized protein n=1 Tax=Fusarium zealandicum TaxID=1053134 RepID=A0A8H4UNG5_9HYPO|nr:hypothetical protein FZEAL_3652 [Fusarium zealandicum]
MRDQDLRIIFGRRALRQEMALRLCYEPPLTLGPSANTSGLDCLVYLIRHCNAYLEDYARIREEEANPILVYAWQAMGNIDMSAEEQEQYLAAKLDLLEQLADQGLTAKTFESYFLSELMNVTLWSSVQWNLYRCEFTLPEEGDLLCSDSLGRSEAAATSLIHFDCRRDPSTELQATISQRFKPRKINGQWSVLITNGPNFVRVHYFAHEQQPWPMSELNTFEVPIGDTITDEDGQHHLEMEAGRLQYVLNTVVRVRDTPQGHDCMRTYEPNGRPVLLPIGSPSYVSDDCDVSDRGGHEYFLVYLALAPNPAETRPTLPRNRLPSVQAPSSQSAPMDQPVAPVATQKVGAPIEGVRLGDIDASPGPSRPVTQTATAGLDEIPASSIHDQRGSSRSSQVVDRSTTGDKAVTSGPSQPGSQRHNPGHRAGRGGGRKRGKRWARPQPDPPIGAPTGPSASSGRVHEQRGNNEDPNHMPVTGLRPCFK